MGATLSWQGRELQTYENDEFFIEYEYDENGMRYRTTVTSKEDNEVGAFDYIWEDQKLISMVFSEGDTQKLAAKYLYNNSGEVIGFQWVSGSDAQPSYYYLKNLQGDITGIVNSSGKMQISYSYDVFGKRTTKHHADTSTMAGIAEMMNQMFISMVTPFGYRGYCYDEYTDLYYLQSRYYDPNTGRFINADDTNYLNVTGTVLSCNLFAYCENDAVNRVDPSGNIAWSIVAKVFLGVLSQYAGDIIGNIISGKTGINVYKPTSKFSAYVSAGATALIGGNKLLSSVGRAVISTFLEYIEDAIRGKKQSISTVIKNLLKNLAIDLLCSFISKVAVKYIRSLSPKNYSSFANSKYLKSQNLSRTQILKKMQRLVRLNIFSANVFDFFANSVANAV